MNNNFPRLDLSDEPDEPDEDKNEITFTCIICGDDILAGEVLCSNCDDSLSLNGDEEE